MNQSDRPLVQALQNFKKQLPVSFHVPGHKHGLLSGLPDELRRALAYDFTELTGLDDLHEADGVIREAEELLSALYQSTRSFFLVNGSTVGNLAMIYATCSQGDSIIVQRNAHKSVFNAIELIGAEPVLITPPWNLHTRTPGVLIPEQVKEALDAYPNAKAVVLTYPTYYGVAGEGLREIIELAHAYSVPVLVDEAHGAHFIIGDPFPQSAIELGADVVVHSAHKTLPAMTMGSFLHVRSEIIDDKKIAHYLQMLQSSSPSYLLMASLDDARAYAALFTENDKQHFLKVRRAFIQELKSNTPFEVVETDDPLKLLIRIDGYTGFQLQAAFESIGIYAELADPYQVLFILPLWDERSIFSLQDWIKKMVETISLLGKEKKSPVLLDIPVWPFGISSLVHSPSTLAVMETEWISIEESAGRVVATSLIPYPPGIPLLVKGERILGSHLKTLSILRKMGAKFHGADRLTEEKIHVLKRDSEE